MQLLHSTRASMLEKYKFPRECLISIILPQEAIEERGKLI